MGIAYCHDARARLSVSVWDGEVTSDDRVAHISALASDREWGTGGLLLTDLRGVSRASLPQAEQILEAAGAFLQHLAPQVRTAKWAMVAGDTFDQAKRFGAYIEEEVERLIVFNDLDTACIWLGADKAEVRAIVARLRDGIRSGAVSQLT
jgi:hypothetical protein